MKQEQEEVIALNGVLMRRGEAGVDPRDRGLMLGDGLFETLPVYAGRPFRLDDHLDRMRAGAAVLAMPFTVQVETVMATLRAVLDANGRAAQDAAIRITLTRGAGPRGLLPPANPRPLLMIAASPLAPAPDRPLAARIVSIRRNEGSPSAQLKTLGYLDNVLALAEAAALGADEAILCNNHGNVACASRANLFLVRGGALMTPLLADGVLPGITRRIVIELARAFAIDVVERSIAPEALMQGDGVFMTNSLLGIVPLAAINDRAIAASPLIKRLTDAYRRLMA